MRVQVCVAFRQLRAVFWLLAALPAAALAQEEFPGRELYPTTRVIELADLKQQLNDVTVVDVRSAYEYQTLRIRNAENVPLSTKDFTDSIQKLIGERNKPVVFYCNGKTCLKSYKASRKCNAAGIENTLAFDAGIMDWVKAYPEEAELLGKGPVDPAKLISKEKFEQHLLSPDQFADRTQENAIVLDVRDRFQRDAVSLFIGRDRRVALDDTAKLNRYIAKAKEEGKTLLIYDAVGKQVRWLQYYLADQEVPSYYFMKGGAKAFYDSLAKDYAN